MSGNRSGEETVDPTADRPDPRCPSCDGKVGARASYCIHCWRDLPDGVGGDRIHSAEYDEVTGGTHEVSHSTDDVTAATPDVRDSDGGETLLTRLRTGMGERRSETTESGRRDADRPPVPSGRGTDGPAVLPDLLDDEARAGKFLAGLGAVGAVAVLGVGLEVPVAAALVAALAWVGSTGWLARHRSGFDAMRYGSYNMMLTLICASFALAFAFEGSALVPVAFALVPIAASTLLVGGLGYTTTDDR